MPLDRLNKTVRTVYRGNSEYAFTNSGNTVRLRRADGSLTQRGTEMYQQEEITVEVPAIQVGTNKLDERYRIPTYKVFTENEFPEMGEVFRNAAGNDVARFRAVHEYIHGQLSDGDLLMEESAQVWLYDTTRRFIFRVRRMVGNELKVEKMELSHKVPLRYDFMRIQNMLPGALDWGGKCVPRQVEQLLGQNYDKEFEALWDKETPWDGQCTIEMMQEFARVNDINLIAFHGNRKCVHQTAESEKWLTMFVWDEHGYFV